MFVLAVSLARAQDAATQQQLDQISGRIQDIYGVLDKQDKRLAALEKSVSDLQDKLNQPVVNNSASADDLKKLAEQVKELAQKQQDDNDVVLKEFEKLEKAGGPPAPGHKTPGAVAPTTNNSNVNAGDKQNGYWQPVGRNDTISAIAKAYQDKGIKVTVKQILDANPGLDPNHLKVNQKIWIPDPSAK